MSRRFLAALALSAAAMAGVTEPRPAPDFLVEMPGGAPIHISQYKGKTVAFIFILTTCPHCQKTVGFLSQFQKQYGARGFQAVACAIEEKADLAVPGFVKNFQVPFPVGYSMSGQAVLDFMQHPPMLIPHMPLLTLIDRQGRIRAQYEGQDPFLEESVQEANLRKAIEGLLNEGATRGKKAASKKPEVSRKKSE